MVKNPLRAMDVGFETSVYTTVALPVTVAEEVVIQLFELITFQLQTLLVVTLTDPVAAR